MSCQWLFIKRGHDRHIHERDRTMKSTTFASIAIRLTVALALGPLPGATGAESCPLAAEVASTRIKWYSGEPVEIRVRLSNPQSRSAVVALTYPALSGSGAPGIIFSLSEDVPAGASPLNAIESLVEIAPHSSWDIHVYANKYIPSVVAGTNRVQWRLELACLGGQNMPLARLIQNGWFNIVVEAKPAPNPAAVIDTYFDRFNRLDQRQRWARREAVEALSNMSDPAVLPALQKLYLYGRRSAALRALLRFDGNPAAARLLIDILKSTPPQNAREAWQVAKDWRVDLAPRLLEELLTGQNGIPKLALVDYLSARRSNAYDLLLQRLAASPEEDVAQAAKAVLTKPTPRR
jgi:hypothetical protein